MQETKYIIESILFASGESVNIAKIAEIIGYDYEDIYPVICELRDEYDEKQRGMSIIITNETAKMISRDKYFPYIKELLASPENTTLSQAALETLAIVAYRQPVTRSDIESIRGVQSSSSLDTLLARGLVRSAGRLELPGRPVGYVTTDEFLQFMQIEDIKELPQFESFASMPLTENEETN
ncbi:MAG: SMC-Scp complex subunit ScpB [Anaerofustis stercorihominis]|nr:SMC-Scp complex subunit ScpB [Anaerofustis stercorihominis]